MAVAEILTQDEIDALLHGVESGDIETESGPPLVPGEVMDYDFTSQDRIVRARFPTLDIINQRFVRQLRLSIFNMLRRTVDVTTMGVQMMKYSEYANSLYVPTSLNLMHLHPMKGTALLVFDPKLVFTIVDKFFGGDGRFLSRMEGREFTPVEQRVIELLRQMVFFDVKEAWAPILAVKAEFGNMEIDPHFANIVSPSEVVIVSPFHIEFEGGSGDLHITVPYSMIEPVRELLEIPMQNDRVGTDEQWLSSMRNGLLNAEVELSGRLVEIRLTMRVLSELQPGDVIPFELPEEAVIQVEDIPFLHGMFGQSDGKNAVKVTERIGNSANTQSAATIGVGR